MNLTLKIKSAILLGSFAFFFSSCGVVTNPNFIRHVGILGAALARTIIVEIIENGIDRAFSAIFDETLDKTSDVVQIEPLMNNNLLGRKVGEHLYLIEGGRNEKDYQTTISIPTSRILFSRHDVNSVWQLTPKSRALILKRLETASVQLSLLDLGYNLGKYEVDGVKGNFTIAAVKSFQKKQGLKSTGELDDITKQLLLGS